MKCTVEACAYHKWWQKLHVYDRRLLTVRSNIYGFLPEFWLHYTFDIVNVCMFVLLLQLVCECIFSVCLQISIIITLNVFYIIIKFTDWLIRELSVMRSSNVDTYTKYFCHVTKKKSKLSTLSSEFSYKFNNSRRNEKKSRFLSLPSHNEKSLKRNIHHSQLKVESWFFIGNTTVVFLNKIIVI